MLLPSIDIQPPGAVRISGELEIIEGNALNLTCSASGFPQPEIMLIFYADSVSNVSFIPIFLIPDGHEIAFPKEFGSNNMKQHW